MTIQSYVNQLSTRFKSGISREHSYRADLENLIRDLVQGVEITNEPANVTDCGNPDYVITRKKIPVGYIEAKDIGKDLNSKGYKEQFNRYKKALDNLIITDYTWFQFFQNGELVHEIRIAEIEGNKITSLNDNFEQFEALIKDFCEFVGQTIKSSRKLAEMMAAKAKLLENILERAVTSDEETKENTSLKGQYESFKHILIHDLSPKGFADIYAQTLAYGMFAARLHDPTLEDFSRQEAAELIPKTNPFLRRLFQYVAGYDIDNRIKTTVDNLAEVFRATNVNALLHNFGKSTQTNDPIIHFYETFLSEYDPKLRKSRGVWYTPEPVVKFIVRAVDDILKTEFNLPEGLADTSKTKIKIKDVGKATADRRSKTKQIEREIEVHKVQILDPAAGTGTFLAEVVKHIYNSRFKHMQGIWSSYVENDLIPRLNGFELLMASYSMAHLKLDMLLTETGYKAKKDQRFNIYLTNSLEEHHPDTGTLFAGWLSSEANEANHIKRDTPVMCVIGNPPYSVSSSNKSEWIEQLMQDYKKDLNERNIQPLSDDYIKFIRYGQHFIEKNGEGVLAYISNNSFIDGLIHRQMRKELLQTFDKIYILDLHGNSKKEETTPEGGKDENVFDIMQGVSINIFVKSNEDTSDVFHFDVYGTRKQKYNFLEENHINSIGWKKPELRQPNYYFVVKDFSSVEQYEQGLKVNELFVQKSLGIEFGNKVQFLSFEINDLKHFVEETVMNKSVSNQEIENEFGIKSTSGWRFEELREKELKVGFVGDKLRECSTTPFDIRKTYHSRILRRPQLEVLRNLYDDNIALLTLRQSRNNDSLSCFITNLIYSKDVISMLDRATGFPLYIYPEISDQQSLEQSYQREPNLNMKIVEQFVEILKLDFVSEKEERKGTLAPIDILDYIYAVLHSTNYREKYKEFLKIDFPRVPYPKDAETFWKLVEIGGQIREIHLLESEKVNQFITNYPESGSNTVEKPRFEIYVYESTLPGEEYPDYLGAVYINETQYFADVPLSAWEFYIGGYQPAQKWLKDRKGRTLTFEDILHYQKIIVALTETDRLMKAVDEVGVE